MSILSESDNYFGLDIGNAGVRVVQLRRGAGKPTLVTYGDAPLPPGAAQSDSPIDQDKIVEVIRQLVKDARISSTKVVAGIPSNQAFASTITTPRLTEGDLEKAMRLQAEQYVPMAVDQVKMDWEVVGPGKTDKDMQVLLVSAPNTVINKYLSIVEKAGLEMQALEVNAIALSRSLMPANGLAVIIVNIGSTTSDITIVQSGTPRLIRSVNVGGNTFVKAISQNLGLDEVQAQQFAQKFGLTQTKLEGQVFRAIKSSLDLLTDEIDKSVKFFNTQNEGVKLEKMILTGGTAALPELPVYMANTSGLPVEMGNPWANVSYPAAIGDRLMMIGLEYGIAVGLAQRTFI